MTTVCGFILERLCWVSYREDGISSRASNGCGGIIAGKGFSSKVAIRRFSPVPPMIIPDDGAGIDDGASTT